MKCKIQSSQHVREKVCCFAKHRLCGDFWGMIAKKGVGEKVDKKKKVKATRENPSHAEKFSILRL